MKPKAVAALMLVAALAAGCGGTGKPHFESAAGWRVLPGQDQLAAANVPFASTDRGEWPSPPSRTVATLPRGGVVIWAMVSHSTGSGSTPLPLRLTEAVASNPIEGFGCAPAVTTAGCYSASGSIRHLEAQDGGYATDLYVFFGSDHPPATAVRAANAELARLQLPREKQTASALPVCPARSGDGAYDTRLSRSAGPAGSRVTVSGALGVLREDGTYGGQTAKDADAYWNLDFHKWWSALGSKPVARVPGSPVVNLGRQEVARRCAYRLRVTIPSVRPGSYSIEVLAGAGKSQASFAPVSFRVTRG
jgi:hypothetical protein